MLCVVAQHVCVHVVVDVCVCLSKWLWMSACLMLMSVLVWFIVSSSFVRCVSFSSP